MIETDLADLYGIPTKGLNQAIRGNLERVPSSFIFRLAAEEKQGIVTTWTNSNSPQVSLTPSLSVES